MTNAVAVIGLTFDATDIQQDPIGIFLEIIHGLNESPSVRGVDTVIPSMIGRVARNRKADTWRIELHGYVAGIGDTEAAQREDFRDLVATLKTLFDPTADPVALVATLEDGGTMTIMARALPTPLWNQIVPSIAEVSYELEAVEDWTLDGGS